VRKVIKEDSIKRIKNKTDYSIYSSVQAVAKLVSAV